MNTIRKNNDGTLQIQSVYDELQFLNEKLATNYSVGEKRDLMIQGIISIFMKDLQNISSLFQIDMKVHLCDNVIKDIFSNNF